jgi:hypothetical protein
VWCWQQDRPWRLSSRRYLRNARRLCRREKHSLDFTKRDRPIATVPDSLNRRSFGCYHKLLWTNSYFVNAGLQTNPWNWVCLFVCLFVSFFLSFFPWVGPQIFQKSRSSPPGSRRQKGNVKQFHCWGHGLGVSCAAVIWRFSPGACALIHIFVYMSKNWRNYAELIGLHCTKFSRAAGQASGICAPLHSILPAARCIRICHVCYLFPKTMSILVAWRLPLCIV